MTRREAMLAALQARLEALAAQVTDLRVLERNFRGALTHSPSLVLRDGGQSTDADGQTEYKSHAARPSISGFVQARSDADLGPAVNALYGALIDWLEADESLSGTADDILERGFETELDLEEGAKQASCWFTLFLEIPYTSARLDSSQA